jgi:lipopolysaccharide/colanic/teichoic acid biosynthesis glycosyltransferase
MQPTQNTANRFRLIVLKKVRRQPDGVESGRIEKFGEPTPVIPEALRSEEFDTIQRCIDNLHLEMIDERNSESMSGEMYGMDLTVPFREGHPKSGFPDVHLKGHSNGHPNAASNSSSVDVEVPSVGTVQLLWTSTVGDVTSQSALSHSSIRSAFSKDALTSQRRRRPWSLQSVGLGPGSALGESLVLDIPGDYRYPAGGYAPTLSRTPAQKVHGHEATANLFRYRVVKRVIDVILIALSIPVLIPVLFVLALLVRLTSHGPAFFSHRRICRSGDYFPMWKFRTMCVNSAEVLEQHLAANPEAKAEWEQNHKLQDDPRVTRLGRFMRRTSLDELPQLWNVLHGTMSLVGPRPIVTAEIEKYGECFHCYTSVKPGVTGLWQVSGRSKLSYQARVRLDCEYATRWSLGRDLRILLSTFRSVMGKDGAY